MEKQPPAKRARTLSPQSKKAYEPYEGSGKPAYDPKAAALQEQIDTSIEPEECPGIFALWNLGQGEMGWLIKKGWKWKRGSGLRDFLYLRPGITRLRNAIENVHYFTSLPSMHEWVKANWRSGEWKRKLELTARPASAASLPAVQADSKALRESVAAGGKVRIGPDGVPIRGPNDARPVGNVSTTATVLRCFLLINNCS
jgi:hypothetical protein